MSKAILVVDDDVDVTEQHRLILENIGYNPIVANNVGSAWEALEKNKIDLIILDVMMERNSDGFNMAQQLKVNEDYKDIPIIMVTSVNQKMPFKFDKDSDGGFLPVDEFMEKPIDPEKLIENLKKLLED